MPARIEQANGDGVTIRQIVASSTENDFLEHLIDAMRVSDYSELLHILEKVSLERDSDIENICTTNHEEFVGSVRKLDEGREDCTSLGNEILSLVHSYQSSTDNLAAQKKNLVDSRNVRGNVDESTEALRECLDVLRLSNHVHDLVAKQNHYAALRALDELQSSLQLRKSARYQIGEMITNSIPATQKMIAEAVMTDLNTWLFHIRDVSQYIGEVAFFKSEQRRQRQKARAERNEYFGSFKMNSPIELVADETEEYDVLNDDEAALQVDFTPLFECLHIHAALGQSDRFRSEYAATRRRQKELIIPATLKLNDEEALELKGLLENIAGFAIVERATFKKTENLRTSADMDELWDSMCQSAITLLSGAVMGVDDTDMLLRVTGIVSLFIQTMESFQFHSSSFNAFLMTLFQKYALLLKRRCSEDFQEIVSTDDYMPMPVNNLEEYDKIIGVGYYAPDKDREEINFPMILPFSQMYPMCCIDIRNFLSQVYSAPDDYLQRSSVVDETIKNSLDELLCDRICQPLIEGLSSQYPGQIVQILTNLEYFERMSEQLQVELAQTRISRAKSGVVALAATGKFKAGKKRAERRVFELVNSKIDELIDTAEYDWTSTQEVSIPSNYMTELTQYLSNIMTSMLLALPTEVKEQIYFDALIHAASNILTLPLDPSVKIITPPSLRLLSLDVTHLSTFISSLSLPPSTTTLPPRPASQSFPQPLDQPTKLQQNLAELTQTVALMSSSNPDEYFDITQRSKNYSAVDPQNGPLLLEKVEAGRTQAEEKVRAQMTGQGMPERTGTPVGGSSLEARMKAQGERFGSVMRGFRGKGEGSG